VEKDLRVERKQAARNCPAGRFFFFLRQARAACILLSEFYYESVNESDPAHRTRALKCAIRSSASS